MKTNQTLDMAYEEIQRMSLSEEERKVYFAREKALADLNSLNAQAREERFAQGVERVWRKVKNSKELMKFLSL